MREVVGVAVTLDKVCVVVGNECGSPNGHARVRAGVRGIVGFIN